MSRPVLIVGAGPAGMFAAFALGQLGLDAVLVDALPAMGGQCAALYPEKPIYDIPGRPQVTAGALVEDLAAQMAPYAPEFRGGQPAIAIDDVPGGFSVRLADGTQIAASAVILALGGGAFRPNRPPIPGIEAYEGRSVHYAVRSRAAFAGRRVAIAGGGDSALDWALALAGEAAGVHLIHRRPTFRAAPATVAALHAAIERGAITLHAPSQLCGLRGTDGVLAEVELRPIGGDPHAATRIPADALLAFYGLATDFGALEGWGIGADGRGIPVDTATMGTCRPGVFAIGDVAAYPGKLKLILTAFAEGAAAAHGVRRHLFPQEAFHFEHSTTRGVPLRAAPASEA
jgi:thioredoxin reductase (NADPH)